MFRSCLGFLLPFYRYFMNIVNNLFVNFLGLKFESYRKILPDVFLNILITDLRDFGVKQKAVNFYSVIEKCINEGELVNVVVPLVGSNSLEVRNFYFKVFARYLECDRFNVIFVLKSSPFRSKQVVCLLLVPFFLITRGSLPCRFNLACLCSWHYLRLLSYYRIFDYLSCDNWLGLTGNIELLSLFDRKKRKGSETSVNALQFGQAALDQLHFKNYFVDFFFSYDEPSKEIYTILGIEESSIIVCGSPEFEHYLSSIEDKFIDPTGRLNVLFIDQPVSSRIEYSAEYLSLVYDYFVKLSDDPLVDFKVKRHPRGSAFSGPILKSASSSDDICELLSSTHVVISFFSNLCDLALLKNKPTLCLRADSVLSERKIDWMVSLGCKIVANVEELSSEIEYYRDSPESFADKLAPRVETVYERPSEIIFSRLKYL